MPIYHIEKDCNVVSELRNLQEEYCSKALEQKLMEREQYESINIFFVNEDFSPIRKLYPDSSSEETFRQHFSLDGVQQLYDSLLNDGFAVPEKIDFPYASEIRTKSNPEPSIIYHIGLAEKCETENLVMFKHHPLHELSHAIDDRDLPVVEVKSKFEQFCYKNNLRVQNQDAVFGMLIFKQERVYWDIRADRIARKIDLDTTKAVYEIQSEENLGTMDLIEKSMNTAQFQAISGGALMQALVALKEALVFDDDEKITLKSKIVSERANIINPLTELTVQELKEIYLNNFEIREEQEFNNFYNQFFEFCYQYILLPSGLAQRKH